MKRFIFLIITSILIFSSDAIGQKLSSGNIMIYKFSKVDLQSRTVAYSQIIVVIGDVLYKGDNLNFDALICGVPKEGRDSLFLSNYKYVIDENKLKKKLKKLNNQTNIYLSDFFKKQEKGSVISGVLEDLVNYNCISTKDFSSFMVASVSLNAIYFLIDCDKSKTEGLLYCDKMPLGSKIPIIVRII